MAQPGRALAWGARGRQFKSARPDHLLCIIPTLAQQELSLLPTASAPTRLAASEGANPACEGCEPKPSLRQFKSARPDHSFRNISIPLSKSACCRPRSAPTRPSLQNAANPACEGCEPKPSLRQFKSARPDHSFRNISTLRSAKSACCRPRSAPTRPSPFRRPPVQPARGQQFESARPDHSFRNISTLR